MDINSIFYKLHFVHYSIVNDFFSFRLITPAIVSELLRFDIIYIPGGNSIHLFNRTIIAKEGGLQIVSLIIIFKNNNYILRINKESLGAFFKSFFYKILR